MAKRTFKTVWALSAYIEDNRIQDSEIIDIVVKYDEAILITKGHYEDNKPISCT